MPPRLPALLILCLLALAPPAPADDEQPAEKRAAAAERLDRVRAEITALQQRVATQQAARGSVSSELREVDLAVAAILAELDRLGARLAAQQREMAQIEARRDALQAELATHRASLREQLRAAFRTGQTPMLQLLLKQQDPARLSRALRYYDYFNRARLAAIERAETLLAELAALAEREANAAEQLRATRQQTSSRHAALQERQTERRGVLARLGREISATGGEIRRLEGDAQRLQALLDELGQILADIPPPPREREPFDKRRGKLPWPVQGRVLSAFGSRSGNSPLSSQGLVIAASTGDPVQAVHHGHVVYADWLQGFGMIAIVDHGDGYMSLYGNNRALFKETGDWVASGERLATVGDDGGPLSGGMYFEIRRKGRPIDPVRWLRRGGG